MLQISKIFQRFYAIIFKFQGKSIQIFKHLKSPFTRFRSSRPEVFLRKGVLEICSKFTGEHPCQSVILIKLQNNFIDHTLAWMFSCIFSEHLFLGTPLRAASDVLIEDSIWKTM